MKNQSEQSFDFTVVGGGLAGLLCALKLAQFTGNNGKKIALIAPADPSNDLRTTAMLMPTIAMLEELGLWKSLKPLSAPLSTMRLVDGSSRLIRSPVADFKAVEADLEAFGYNVPNADIVDLLNQELAENANIVRFHSLLRTGECRLDKVLLELDDETSITSKLVIAADGKHSKLREIAGITKREWSYPQTAIVLTFSHSLPHGGISAEFHTETGPFTQVPLPSRADVPNRSSLVWVVHPDDAEALQKKNLMELSDEIEVKLHSMFGKCRVENTPGSIPLNGMLASRFAQNRIALVGEAGHVFPPIGAQGFNLGARDILELIELLNGEKDPGTASILTAYHQKRQSDIRLRTIAVDVMNRSLLTDFLPVQALRAAGISALNTIPPLRKMAIQQGLGGRVELPSPTSIISRLARRKQVNR